MVDDETKSMVIVTGSCGFIGFHVSKNFLERGYRVIGIDNMNDYYDIKIKKRRNNILKGYKNYEFYEVDVSDFSGLKEIFDSFDGINGVDRKINTHKVPKIIIHLAGYAGVRNSMKFPIKYVNTNLNGFINLCEIARTDKVNLIIYASSSSVYGNRGVNLSDDSNSNSHKSNHFDKMKEDDPINEISSIYAMTKRAMEHTAKVYFMNYGLKSIGLRFFSVFGEWGRPDMAYFKFTKNVMLDRDIVVYNKGINYRDNTYVGNVVQAINKIVSMKLDNFKCEILNVGSSRMIKTTYLIDVIEKETGKKAKIIDGGIQKSDVFYTFADITKAKELINYEPKVNFEEGMRRFVSWFLSNKEWLLKLR